MNTRRRRVARLRPQTQCGHAPWGRRRLTDAEASSHRSRRRPYCTPAHASPRAGLTYVVNRGILAHWTDVASDPILVATFIVRSNTVKMCGLSSMASSLPSYPERRQSLLFSSSYCTSKVRPLTHKSTAPAATRCSQPCRWQPQSSR